MKDGTCKNVCKVNKDARKNGTNDANGIGMLDSYCKAWDTADQAKLYDMGVLAMSATALGVCATGCALQAATGGHPGVVSACNKLGVMTEAADIARSVILNKDAGITDHLENNTKNLAGILGITVSSKITKGGNRSKAVSACVGAVFMGIQVKERKNSLDSQTKVAKDTCTQIQELVGGSQSVKDVLADNNVRYNATILANMKIEAEKEAQALALAQAKEQSGQSGGNDGSVSTAIAAVLPPADGAASTPAITLAEPAYGYNNCLANGGNSMTCAQSVGINLPPTTSAGGVFRAAATSSGSLLSREGLDKAFAAGVTRDGARNLARLIDRGASANQIIQASLPSNIPSDYRQGMRDFAQLMDQSPRLKAPSMVAGSEGGTDSSPAYGGVSGGGMKLAPSHQTAEAAPYGDSFGADPSSGGVVDENPAGRAAAGLPAARGLASAPSVTADPDIHPASGPSLFQIVSHRLNESSGRIQAAGSN